MRRDRMLWRRSRGRRCQRGLPGGVGRGECARRFGRGFGFLGLACFLILTDLIGDSLRLGSPFSGFILDLTGARFALSGFFLANGDFGFEGLALFGELGFNRLKDLVGGHAHVAAHVESEPIDQRHERVAGEFVITSNFVQALICHIESTAFRGA